MIQETSLQSFKEIQPKLSERHSEIYNALKELCTIQGDATDQEIKVKLGKAEANYVRPRRFELVNKLKMVGFSQKRQCKITGKTCLAWKTLTLNNQKGGESDNGKNNKI